MNKQSGMGMVEILVALLITAVGLIGITGMQAVSLKNNLSALNRSNAMFLSGTMSDRIRTNPNANYLTAFDDAPPISFATCSAASSDCSIANIANTHITHWKCMLGGYQTDANCDGMNPVMPDAVGQITQNADGDYVIAIAWTDRVSYADGANTGGQAVSITTTLR